MSASSALSPHVSHQLARALQNLQYGTVQLIVHEGRLVRIERIERIRLTDPPDAPAPPPVEPV